MNKLKIYLNSSRKKLCDESGTIESALVMLPLIALFLITLQLIATVNLRNVEMAHAQSRAARQAVQLSPSSDTTLVSLDSRELFSKLRLVIVRAEQEIPRIFPGINQLIGERKLESKGVAVYEEPETCSGGYLLC